MNRVPNLFIEVKSLPDVVRVQYSIERHRDLEKKQIQKMNKLKSRLNKIKKKK